MKHVCVACQLFFKNYKSGVYVEEGMPYKDTDGTTKWRSYKLWCCDLKKCQGCGAEMLAGFGAQPIAEHYQSNYTEMLTRCSPIFRIDDCGNGPYHDTNDSSVDIAHGDDV